MCDNCKYTYWREELRKEREKNAILKRFEASATTQAAEAQERVLELEEQLSLLTNKYNSVLQQLELAESFLIPS